MRIKIMMLIFLGTFLGVSAQTNVTPTPTPIQSIFDYDTCSPPCWMGLTPGESDSQDLQQMFEGNSDLINPQWITGGATRLDNGEYAIDANTGLILLGVYTFDVGERDPTESRPGTLASRIEIRNGRIQFMSVRPNELIPLSTVISRLHTPDIVRLGDSAVSSTYIRLVYLVPRLRISLRQPTDACRISTLMNRMTVATVHYHSVSEAVSLIVTIEGGIPQPALTRYVIDTDRDVPIDLWLSWLDGENDLSCEEAWLQLEPRETPSIPSQLPTIP